MERGTTPTLIFNLKLREDQIEDGYITFAQRGIVCLDKRITDEAVTVGDYHIKVRLTQEETMNFTSSDRLKIQLRLRLKGGATVTSNVISCRVGESLRLGVI